MRTLWIVSGGTEAVPGIQRAKEMGLHVVVSDGNPDAPAFALADDCIVVSTYDVESTVEAARRYHRTVRPIDGVICIASDVPLTVASVAAELGLPGISIETACLAADKLAMKHCFAAAGVPIPWFSPVDSAADLRAIAAERGLPLVVKPVDSRGARGVLKLTAVRLRLRQSSAVPSPKADVDLDWAFRYAQQFSPSSRVMVEEYLTGPQISTESVLLNGVGYTPGFSDRNYEYLDRFAPYVIENGGQQPSALSREDQKAVAQLAEQAGRALGIMTGIAKGDMVLTSEGPKVIEIAARLSGGWFCTDQIPIGTGVDLVGVAIRLALGETVAAEELVPRYHRGVAIRYFFPKPGRVVAIKNADRFDDVPWIHRLGFFVGLSDIVEPVTNHTKRAGFVITTGETRDQAIRRALHLVDTIEIVTVPA